MALRNSPELNQALGTAKKALADVERGVVEIKQRAANENRHLSRTERASVAAFEMTAQAMRSEIRTVTAAGAFDPRAGGGVPAEQWHGSFGSGGDDLPGRLRPEQRFVDWARQHDGGGVSQGMFDELTDPGRGAVGKLVRGMVTGRWPQGEGELRALVEGTDASGGYLIPSPLASRVIDRLRNAAQVLAAGATTVPIPPAIEYSLARLTGGATPAWKVENDPISDSDLSFDRIVFRPKTLPVLIKLSMELFEDLSPDANSAIEAEIAKCLGLGLDAAALRGSGVDPVPQGIRFQAGVTLQTLGTGNGLSPPGWDFVVDAISAIRNANGTPTGIIWAPRTQQTADKWKNSLGVYLLPPPSVAALPIFQSNQIPDNLTVGTSSDCSKAFVGSWSSCLVGIRSDLRFQVRVLDQRYADLGQYALLAYLRADVALEHPFTVVEGIRP